MGVNAEDTSVAGEFEIGDHPALRNYYENLRHAPWKGPHNLEYGHKQQTEHWRATGEAPGRMVIEVTGLKSFVDSTEGPIFFWADTLQEDKPVCVMAAKATGHADLLVTLAIQQSPSSRFTAIYQEVAALSKRRKRVVACGLPRLLGSVGKPFTPTMLIEEGSFWVEVHNTYRGRMARLIGGIRNIFRRTPRATQVYPSVSPQNRFSQPHTSSPKGPGRPSKLQPSSQKTRRRKA